MLAAPWSVQPAPRPLRGAAAATGSQRSVLRYRFVHAPLELGGETHDARRLAFGIGDFQLTCRFRPSQNGARRTRLRILPGPDVGSGSSRMSTLRGHL